MVVHDTHQSRSWSQKASGSTGHILVAPRYGTQTKRASKSRQHPRRMPTTRERLKFYCIHVTTAALQRLQAVLSWCTCLNRFALFLSRFGFVIVHGYVYSKNMLCGWCFIHTPYKQLAWNTSSYIGWWDVCAMWRTVIIRRGVFFKPLHNTHVRLDSKVCVYVFHKLHTNNRAFRPCHSSHPMPLALICTRGINGSVCVCVCVCVYKIAHKSAQSS